VLVALFHCPRRFLAREKERMPMVRFSFGPYGIDRSGVTLAWALAVLLSLPGTPANAQQAGKIRFLHIGTSGGLALNAGSGVDERAAIDTLVGFIKSETGFDNDIVREKTYDELVRKMADGQLQLGVFQGYEFAWAQAKDAKLQPLALAVDMYIYRFAYLMVNRDSKIANFAALQGQTLSLPNVGQGHLQLYLERLSEAQGKPLQAFLSKIKTPDNIEDALDDVVDGVVQATVVDRVGLEVYKRRKPGRFNRLRELMHSQAFPPPLVAYYDNVVDGATRQRFQQGLLTANQKEKGQTLLTLFRLTGFTLPPNDFGQVLAQTLKNYPPPSAATK
jgi:ABC-type phosphate/phosphonate transport system substrate-binding protein